MVNPQYGWCVALNSIPNPNGFEGAGTEGNLFESNSFRSEQRRFSSVQPFEPVWNGLEENQDLPDRSATSFSLPLSIQKEVNWS